MSTFPCNSPNLPFELTVRPDEDVVIGRPDRCDKETGLETENDMELRGGASAGDDWIDDLLRSGRLDKGKSLVFRRHCPVFSGHPCRGLRIFVHIR